MPHVLGLDASRAVTDRPTGTEGYSYALLRALLPLLHNFRVTLYFRTPPSPALWNGLPPYTTTRVIPFPRLWTHLRLSWEILRTSPDLLFVPAHVLPLVRPQRSLVTIHDLGYRYFPEAHPWRQRLYLDLSTCWSAKVATHILVDSQATRHALVDAYNIPASKITVAYPGYNRDLEPVADHEMLAAVRERYQIPGPYILYLGRIQPRKNIYRLIGAFSRLLPQYPDLNLVLSGPKGWLSEAIHARVNQLGIRNRVHFTGYIAEADKAALLSGARIFAFPSLYEGFGFPVLEAQACGVPVLTSTTTSLPEVAGNGALLVDPLDEVAITQGLLQLLVDQDLRAALVQRGFSNVQRFSWQRTAKLVVNVMDNMFFR
ncbi:MAG: glycosyltransferase family 4 protein [Anaerolineae bacterium]|nr:glycosyltransferase family 4 protein [Anaerolineae bacterium]